jgi:hypothetical protein
LIDDIANQLPIDGCVATVLDTLNRSIAGSESKDADMGCYIKAADALREWFNCAVIIIHHCGIDATRPRGHTSLTGAVDAQIKVRRNDGQIVASVERMKDGPEGDELWSELVSVEVGVDDNGDRMTSCVVREVEAPQTDKGDEQEKKKPARLTPADKVRSVC